METQASAPPPLPVGGLPGHRRPPRPVGGLSGHRRPPLSPCDVSRRPSAPLFGVHYGDGDLTLTWEQVSFLEAMVGAAMDLPGLSFSAGRRFEDDLRASLGLLVSLSPSDSFHLVAPFGRCKFKLSPESVGLILQTTIGGFAAFFKVSALSDRVFKFSVASKKVGLIIRRLISYECTAYKVFFLLWGGGGPNWRDREEFDRFEQEEQTSWSMAPSSRSFNPRRGSFADVVRSSPFPSRRSVVNPAPSNQPNSSVLTGANSIPLGNATMAQAHLTGANAIPLRPQSVPTKSFPLSGANSVPLGQAAMASSRSRDAFASSRTSVFSLLVFPQKAFPSGWSTFLPQLRRWAPPRYPSGAVVPSCPRCLLPGHDRRECRWPIRCIACRSSGHVSSSCPVATKKSLSSRKGSRCSTAGLVSCPLQTGPIFPPYLQFFWGSGSGPFSSSG